MSSANTIIGLCWSVVIVVWLAYGLADGKHSKKPQKRLSMWIRLLLFASFILIFTVKDIKALNDLHFFTPDYFVMGLGVFICMAGLSFAIWARVQIGRNWDLPMSLNENSELITTGPYAIVRHPIYAGLCLAMMGSMVTAGFLLFVWYLAWMLYFIISAVQEDKAMLHKFPKEYPEYKKKTKMLIPLVL